MEILKEVLGVHGRVGLHYELNTFEQELVEKDCQQVEVAIEQIWNALTSYSSLAMLKRVTRQGGENGR